MAVRKLDGFSGFQKALKLFDLVVVDMPQLSRHPDTMRLRSQQLASADSICANIEEGAGRWTTREFIQYLVIARGSAAETLGRYRRMAHWLPAEVVEDRARLCDEIIAILKTTIESLRRGAK